MLLRKPRAAKLLIIEPRYHDRCVLLACYKIKNLNKVDIKKGAYAGSYTISGIAARSYPRTTNGVIDCFAVPIDKLTKKGA